MAKKRSVARKIAEYLIVRSILGFISIFPISFSMKIGEAFGGFCCYLFGRLRRTAFRNLELALPEATLYERKKIVKGVFRSLGRQLGLFSHLGRIKPSEILEITEIVGRENLDKAYQAKKGVIIFTGHFGGWEVSSFLPGLFGYKLNIIVRRIDNSLVEAYVDKIRTSFGTVTLDKLRSSRKVLRILSEGGLVGILADLNMQERDGVFVDFFGIKASTTPAVAKLALMTGAKIVPVFIIWDERKKKYIVNIEPEIEYEKGNASEEAVISLTQVVTKKIEEFVRRFPDQWLWIHKRWKTRPVGERNLY
ncbi:MAG: lysophospholipid acyltransferase family protein [Pyrinomonadaceae bacterium]|nr:lysophospholipid acyltransferase family protein [Pyrinomonadaceae bacterium]MCX7640048.1 lysophospholipid acyltransferase family protein [Pyrinomonadaceae bacterium]MDW8304220.1 lysophospholipid acyltransferase family protein [Acidobacteriota bacterium]